MIDVLGRAMHTLRVRPEATAAMVRALGSARPEEADAVRRIMGATTAIITNAIHEGEPSERDVAVARVLQLVWFSSLIGWVGGVDPVEHVLDDLEAAVRLLLP